MKLCVLDGYAENPGDLSWDWLHALGDCTVYDRTPASEIAARIHGCDIILTNKTPLTAATLAAEPQLRYIGLLSTGFNVVDWAYCRDHGIAVTNIPSYSTQAVAQLTFALILAHTNAVAAHSASVHAGGWAANADFSYQVAPLAELGGKTLGIFGFGKIGKAVAKIGLAFGMRVLACTHHPAETAGVTFVDRAQLLAESDVLTLHCPLTPETEGMVDAAFLAQMKPSALLINTSRGQVINEAALADALRSGVIAGAGLDVLAQEPPQADNPLTALPNCIITPHIAWAAYETRARLMNIAQANLRAFLAGKPENLVY